ncbi:MAG: endonuclease MutS2 [Spirochaetia bacterium]|nr:endonuclease MutS2 [Spirochaetia bacterium]
MEKNILEIMGFSSIKEQLKQYTISDAGKKLIDSQEPGDSFPVWRENSSIFRILKNVLSTGGTFPDVSFPAIEQDVEKAAVNGAVLEAVSIAGIYTFLRSAAVLKKFLFSLEGIDEIRFLAEFDDFTDLRNEISKYLKPDGELKEDSIKELVSIKKRIAAANRQIVKLADDYFQRAEYHGFWQDGSMTIRDGRAVLPLKANCKGHIQGIIHSSSARGTTVFIEPAGMVEKNNELMELEDEYRREILKILRNLTFKIGFRSSELMELSEKIGTFDSFYARIRYTDSYGGIIPEHTERGMHLYEARHLLLGKKAVPVDILIDEHTNVLLISGPNTGGKTVALKTAALLVLMNQFGLGIPAREDSSMAFFDNVLADIGDGQSIENSLSTFSAHMKNASYILENCTEKSLVLLDEPGTGTDPDEGAAIAMAVLDQIIEKNALAMVTTHQSVVKNYAFANPHAENVSVKYDPETFTPLYKLVYGVPGESFGIDIAGKNGIPAGIIDKAREYLGSEKININLMMKQISDKSTELFERQEKIAARELELKESFRDISLKKLQLRQKEYELKRAENAEFSKLVSQAGSQLENLIRELREGELTRDKIQKSRDFLDNMRKEGDRLGTELETLKQEPEKDDVKFKADDFVYVGQSKKDGVIIREMKKGKYLVAVGQMRIVVDQKDLVPGKQRDEKKSIASSFAGNYRKPEFELDIRGCRLDEAISQLERQMDSALLCGLSEFSIIHGTGQGILQKGVRDFLSANKDVESFKFATPENGGFGKTLVKLIK